MDALWQFTWGQLTPTALVAALVFVVGTWLKATIEKGEQHEFDRKIEKLRSELRQAEEAWRSTLKSRDDQIEALRRSALQGLSGRQAVIDKRRLEAADRLWAAVVAKAPNKMALQMVAVLNQDTVFRASEKDNEEGRKLREFGEMLWTGNGLDKLPADMGPLERPFVTPLAWALYSAHQVSTAIPTLQIAALKTGMGTKAFTSVASMLIPIKKALPDRAEYLDRHGLPALVMVLNELEDKLLLELKRGLMEPDGDAASVERAAQIVAAAEDAAAQLQAITAPG